MTNEYRSHFCLIFSQILTWKWQTEEYSNAIALGFTQNHCLAVAIYINPPGLCETRAKHAHTVNNYLTGSLLLVPYFCEEADLRQEKYAQKNQSQLNSHGAALGTQQPSRLATRAVLSNVLPRLSAEGPATGKEQ